jgi:hypothetical protein
MANDPSQTPAPSPSPGPQPDPPRKKRNWFLWGCGGLLAILLIIVATVAITVWWLQRPIKPVVLSPKEKAVVEQKLDRINAEQPDRSGSSKTSASKPALPPTEPDRPYTPGSKSIKLTEREINGLLNANTDLGKTVRIEFGRDAINAYIVAPIPNDVPLVGGKTFRARGRFALSLTQDGTPYAILEDVTVWGVSLPKDWLGGIKGENLLADATGRRHGNPILRGIKSLKVEPGVLVLDLND